MASSVRCRDAGPAYPSNMSTTNPWSPDSGPGSEAVVVEVFSSWLVAQGWECVEHPRYGDHPDIVARHPDGRRLVVEAKGFSRDSGANVDVGYGEILRRMKGEPDTLYALVVAESIVRFAQRVPSEVRGRLGIALYTVDAKGQVGLVDGAPL